MFLRMEFTIIVEFKHQENICSKNRCSLFNVDAVDKIQVLVHQMLRVQFEHHENSKSYQSSN